MKKNLSYLTIAAFLSMLIFWSCSEETIVTTPKPETGGTELYIVVLKPAGNQLNGTGLVNKDVEKFLQSYRVSQSKVVYNYQYALNGFAAYLTSDQLNAMMKDSRVSYIEKDKEMKLIEPSLEQVEGTNEKLPTPQAQTTPWGIGGTNGVGTANGSSLTRYAWIVDTGIDQDHSDLNVNTSLSRTFVRSGKDSRNADDGNGHGTHVAGIIAAKNNTIGVVGVAAGATVVAVKVLNSNGSGYVSDIVAGLDYIRGRNRSGDVINMSLGGGPSTTLDNAVRSCASAGYRVVLAAGNSYDDAGNYSPSRVEATNVWTISAYDVNARFASFSNWGNVIDYSAPGVSVYSCYKNNGYATMSGTSMAAPHVAGILLYNNGTVTGNGTVTNDPDGTADTKAHL